MRGTQFAELGAFVAVAEEASFTKAAKRLGLSNATLSQTVRALEEQLGVRLLNRTTRSVALTDVGERMLSQLRPLLDGFDAVIESVNAFRDKPAGHLRLTIPPPVARFVLKPVLARFLAQYREITIEISVDTSSTDIVAAHFDAGIRLGDVVARDMIAVRATNDMRHIAVASPDYLARRGRPQKPADLQAHDCMRFRMQDGGTIPWKFLVDGKTVEFAVEGSIIANDPELMIDAAVEGAGIIYMFEEYTDDMIADGRLESVLNDYVLPRTEAFFLFYPSRRQNSAALKALIEFLRVNLRTSAKLQER
jgi:DNA-binding transcriptional LysR family regulator